MSSHEHYISIQIPKTGGSALREFYTTLYGGERVVSYYPKGEGLFKSGDQKFTGSLNPKLHELRSFLVSTEAGKHVLNILRKIKSFRNIPKLDFCSMPNDWVVLHGHFNLGQIPEHIKEGAKLVTVIREPWKRVVSQYDYWNQYPFNKKRAWFRPGMPIEEFVLSTQMTNFQSKFLKGSPIMSFDNVGTTDNLSQYVIYFDPNKSVQLKQVNKSKCIYPIQPNQQLIEKFKQMNQQDYELYEEAKRFQTIVH